MRCWHKSLITYLPDMQLKGQWRECVLIADTLVKNGTPNHLLVNRITEYPPSHFEEYIVRVKREMENRGFMTKSTERISKSFAEFVLRASTKQIFYRAAKRQGFFDGWHNKEYLRVCMANLYEKHFFGIGKSRITDKEWETLCRGYKEITGEEYQI